MRNDSKVGNDSKMKAKVIVDDSKMKSEMKSEVKSEIKSKMKSEIKAEMKSKVKSELVRKLEEKLQGGKFRMINEKIYNKIKLSKTDIKKYHEYYIAQIKKWPIDPKNIIIAKLKEMDDNIKTSGNIKIADIGCGSCKIMSSCKNVVSYDMYPVNDKVIRADLESIPCGDKEYDVSVCCLSMMVSFITRIVVEMNRILKVDGVWMVAEVKSRILNVTKFIGRVEKIGFKLRSVDSENTHFVIFEFVKTEDYKRPEKKRLPEIMLEPCSYKKR